MSKKGKIIGSIIGGLVAVGAVIGAVVAFSNMQGPGPNPNPPQTQLATVQNIEYNQEDNLLTWDDVINANSYNVSVNGKETRVEDNFYTVVLTDQTTEFKVQAYDTTNTYLESEWSEPLVITLQQEDSLVADVNEFASKVAREDYVLQKVLSVRPDGTNLITTGVYTVAGDDYLCEWSTRYDHEVNNLEEALQREDVRANTLSLEFDLAKNYDTASSFLARSDYSEQIQSLVNEGYTLNFVTSQAYEAGSDTAGIKGILKASREGESRYYSTDIEIYVGTAGTERTKYTTAVEAADPEAIYEGSFIELTGDFAEYAEELDNLQNTNTTTQDYGMSL